MNSTKSKLPIRQVEVLAWILWFLVTIFLIYKFVVQVSYASVNAYIANEMSFDLAQIGLLGSTYSFAFGAMSVFSGALIDRFGNHRVLTSAAGMIALGAIVFSRGEGWYTLVLGQILMGLGGSFVVPGAGYIIRHWFPIAQFGLMFGLVQSVASCATTFVQSGIGYLLLSFDWREVMIFAGLIGAVLTITMAIVLRDPAHMAETTSKQTSALWAALYAAVREVCVNRQVWIAAISGAMVFGVMLSIGVLWGPKLLLARGFDETTANTVNATIWFGFGLGAPLAALLVNRMRSFRKPFTLGVLALLPLLLVLLFVPNLSTITAYLLFLLIGLFTSSLMISFTVTTQICRDAVAGTALAIVNMIMFVTSGLMISIPARLMSDADITLDNLASGLWLLPACLIIALGFISLMKESFGTVSEPGQPLSRSALETQ